MLCRLRSGKVIAGWSSWQLVGLITRRSGVQIPPPQPYGSIAQLARAFGSYPECHRFESYLSHIRRQTLQGSVFLCFRLKRTRPMTRRDPGDSRRGLPVAEISSAAVSTETSDLSGGQSRRLRLRDRFESVPDIITLKRILQRRLRLRDRFESYLSHTSKRDLYGLVFY